MIPAGDNFYGIRINFVDESKFVYKNYDVRICLLKVCFEKQRIYAQSKLRKWPHGIQNVIIS